jgi:hypothetical protein
MMMINFTQLCSHPSHLETSVQPLASLTPRTPKPTNAKLSLLLKPLAPPLAVVPLPPPFQLVHCVWPNVNEHCFIQTIPDAASSTRIQLLIIPFKG